MMKWAAIYCIISKSPIFVRGKNTKMGKKQEVLDELLTACLQSGNLTFNNEQVRDICRRNGFRNQFDITKLDNRKVMSPLMVERDYFLVHLGKGGRHRFVAGIDRGFHRFENIPENAIVSWPYRRSVLNESNTSESNILSVAANQGILQHFLYGDDPGKVNIYGAHRTKITALARLVLCKNGFLRFCGGNIGRIYPHIIINTGGGNIHANGTI